MALWAVEGCRWAWLLACAHPPALSRSRDPQDPLAVMASLDSLVFPAPPGPPDLLDPLASEE